MLYGNREELLDALKNDSSIFKSISEEFQNDPEILNAVEMIDSDLKSGGLVTEEFTTNAGDVIEFTSTQYEKIIELIKEMRKIHFDIINSVSLVSQVSLSDDDLARISDRINDNIKKLEEMKLGIDDLISKIISSVVIDARVSLKKLNSSQKSGEDNNLNFETENSLDLLTDEQYILGKNSSGDYYLSVSSKLNEGKISNIKSQVISLKPELSKFDFKVDNGQIISSDGYEIVFNGHIEDQVSVEENSDELVVEVDSSSDLKKQTQPLKFDEKVENSNVGDVQAKTSSEEVSLNDASVSSVEVDEVKNDEPLVTTNSEDEKVPSEIDVQNASEDSSSIISPVFDFSPVDVSTFNGEQVNEISIGDKIDTPSEGVISVQEPGSLNHFDDRSLDSGIFDVKPQFVQNEMDCQFAFGKKDGVYYLVISPEISSEDVTDIKMRIAESMPELAGASFVIDYGNILSDSSFETILTGFVKKENGKDFDNFVKR